MPDGPKVGSVNLSPRSDWRMPSDASKVWLEQLKLVKSFSCNSLFPYLKIMENRILK